MEGDAEGEGEGDNNPGDGDGDGAGLGDASRAAGSMGDDAGRIKRERAVGSATLKRGSLLLVGVFEYEEEEKEEEDDDDDDDGK